MLDPNNAGFEHRLLAKIKGEKISPRPRWQFLLKDYLVWLSGLVALIVGGAAISVMIYLFKFNDWEIYDQTKKSFWEFFVLTLPYFWFIFLGLFIFIISYNFKHTKKGYRHSVILLVGASVISSIVLGFVFYAAGLGEKLDNILGQGAPLYDRVINRHIDFWSQPEEGRLSGLIIGIVDEGKFILVDRGQEEWLVGVENSRPYPGAAVVIGQPIRMLGEEVADHAFRADKILPLNAGHDFFHRFSGQMPHNRAGVPGQIFPLPLPVH